MYHVSIAYMIMSVVSTVLTFTPSETEWAAPGVEVEYCSLLVPAGSAPAYEYHLQRKLVIHRE